MRVFFWPRRRLRQALAVSGLAAAVFFCWLLGEPSNRQTSAGMPQAIYQGDPQRQVVALMFNVDWGEEHIPKLLEILGQHGVKGTFFVTGAFAEKFPELVKQIAASGCEIGNHGYGHVHVANLDRQGVKSDIDRAAEVLGPLCSKNKLRFYAPPYGEVSNTIVGAAADSGYQTVLWTIDTVDWQPGRSQAEVVGKVKAKLTNGALILMHPTAVTVASLPEILDHLSQQEYQAVTVSECLTP